MKENERNKDLAHSQEALKRAGLRARKLAEQTDTPLVTFRDGKVQKGLVGQGTAPKGK